MEMIRVGNSTLLVPPMGTGAMTWGDPVGLARLHPAKTGYGGTQGIEVERQAFEASLDAGINFFDTAAMYSGGASEKRLGDFIKGKEVLVASKFPGTFFFKVENFNKELEGSLSRLGRESLDLYQHHFPNDRISITELMNRLADAVEAKKIKAVGVSNYSASQMREAHAALARRGIPLASNQVEYSLLHRKPEADGVLEACRELGITLIAYQPLASGALTGRYLGQERPKGLRRFQPYFRGKGKESTAKVVELLREIGGNYGKSAAQVAIRWLMEQEGVIPIPGAKNGRQASENTGALTFRLTSSELERLDQATEMYRK